MIQDMTVKQLKENSNCKHRRLWIRYICVQLCPNPKRTQKTIVFVPVFMFSSHWVMVDVSLNVTLTPNITGFITLTLKGQFTHNLDVWYERYPQQQRLDFWKDIGQCFSAKLSVCFLFSRVASGSRWAAQRFYFLSPAICHSFFLSRLWGSGMRGNNDFLFSISRTKAR